MRCERFFANATAMAMTEDFGETCPCDARPGVEADAAPGCRFLSYDELPREDIKCSGMCQATDGIIALFVFFFFLAFVALVRRCRREEQAMRRELAYEFQASFDRELARRRLEHSGKEFVAVRQPAGDLELAEVVVLEVEGEAVGQSEVQTILKIPIMTMEFEGILTFAWVSCCSKEFDEVLHPS